MPSSSPNLAIDESVPSLVYDKCAVSVPTAFYFRAESHKVAVYIMSIHVLLSLFWIIENY